MTEADTTKLGPMPAADLGSVFGKKSVPDRTVGLPPLPPRRPTPAPTPMSEPQVTAEPGTEQQAEPATETEDRVEESKPLRPGRRQPATKAPAKKHPPTAPESASAGVDKVAVIYVRESIRRRLRAYCERYPQLVHTSVVLTALEDTYEQLQERFTPHQRPARKTSMFDQAPVRGRRRSLQEPHVQLGIRTSEKNLALIDAMFVDLGAPNRSALIDVALDLYLPAEPNTV